ncbi:hypothetical protein ANCCEY_13117 [Ancylostoma ceylanicum]|uniref:Protein kinase domain-containing protein n=2 Tax=Ancylostoma ceylanicum TaxID=53326 RepID=A0A0D6L9K6_9BILA|nr:hypothetical protein ANCCEY_13117 [Ancylostoma ceylanicum]
MKEARLMRGLDHPNVVKLYGVGVLDRPLYILLEYVAGGSLKTYLRRNKQNITIEEKVQMALGAAWGIDYLHKAEILHRDIAARNCLYDHDSAVLVYEIFSAQDPYGEVGTAIARRKIIEGVLNTFPSDAPKVLVDLVREKMWIKDPDKRTDMEKIVEFLEHFSGLVGDHKELAEPPTPEEQKSKSKIVPMRKSATSAKHSAFAKMRKKNKNYEAPRKTEISQDESYSKATLTSSKASLSK